MMLKWFWNIPCNSCRHGLSLWIGSLLCLALVNVSEGFQTTEEVSAETDFESMWDGLASRDVSVITESVLAFSSNPPGTVEFLETKVQALRLDDETFTALLADLCGDDREKAKAANLQLRYLDPRLLMPIVDLEEKYESVRGEVRIAEVFLDRDYGSFGDNVVEYSFADNGNGEIQSGYQIGRSNYWVSPDIKMLCKLTGRQSWERASCAIKILEHLNSPESHKLLARLAQGDPKCPPTILAREIAMKLKKQDSKQ